MSMDSVREIMSTLGFTTKESDREDLALSEDLSGPYRLIDPATDPVVVLYNGQPGPDGFKEIIEEGSRMILELSEKTKHPELVAQERGKDDVWFNIARIRL